MEVDLAIFIHYKTIYYQDDGDQKKKRERDKIRFSVKNLKYFKYMI